MVYIKNLLVETNCAALDHLLYGGFPTNNISLVYGEARTGKTTLALQCAVTAMKKGFKTIYVDSDNTFPASRFEQIAGSQTRDFLQLFLLLTPKSFKEQAEALEELERYVNRETVLLIVDTITSLYRVEIGTASKTFMMNKELNHQLAYLSKISKERNIVVLLTSQVHFAFEKGVVEPPASRILNYWADIVLQLKETNKTGIREAVLKKYDEKAISDQSCLFRLTEKGIQDPVL